MMADRRFGNVLRWVRERLRMAERDLKRNQSCSFSFARSQHDVDAFKAMVIVMEMETRKRKRAKR